MRLLVVTREPRRFAHWSAPLREMDVEMVASLPERRALGLALGAQPPDVAFADLTEGPVDLHGLRALLAQLYFGSSVGVVAVVRSQALPTFDGGTVDDVLDSAAAPEEALFRARQVCERNGGRRPVIQLGELVVRPAEGLVLVEGRPVPLRHREFELLRFLVHRPNRVFRREELAREVWGPAFSGTLRTVDTHMCRLRTRLGSFGEKHLQTVRGVGYRLAGPKSPTS